MHNNEGKLRYSTYSMLNSLKSAWTSLQSWYICRIMMIVSLYSSRAFDSLSSTSYLIIINISINHSRYRQDNEK